MNPSSSFHFTKDNAVWVRSEQHLFSGLPIFLPFPGSNIRFSSKIVCLPVFPRDPQMTSACLNESKAIPVIGRGGPYSCETSRLPHFLDTRLTGCGEVVSPTCRPLFTPRKIPGTHFCQRLSRPQGHSAAGGITYIEKPSDLIRNRIRDLLVCSIVHVSVGLSIAILVSPSCFLLTLTSLCKWSLLKTLTSYPRNLFLL
jgi:hypothetical protein